ncbi:MFS family permease [Caulobacter ginsengisoli]|uniref:MFS family permease n=1 Tax=Caulobacter ginsengisoli TaxID=400775 RepID=A0ABU0IR50_9CAUL|nr:hypothetical protein [Caulobacter ginsengisoli]MDQ0463831.1 MFS family permease [Caulobacter ginsengisoli]
MAFSPSEVAFEGFRLARQRPLTVVALSVVGLAAAFATYWVMGASGYMQAVSQVAAAGPSADPSAALGLLRPMFLFFAGCALIGCVSTAIQAGAIYRGVLRPQEHGFLGLSFGADELRLLLLGVILVLLGTLVGIALIIVLAIVLSVLGAVLGASGMVGGAILMVLLSYVVMGVVALWLGVKMSFAGPATFARRELSVFASWSQTRGNFWNLLGCYFLAFILALLIGFIMFVVGVTVASVVAGVPFMTAVREFFPSKPTGSMDLYSPVRLTYTLVSALFGGLLNMVLMAPAAEAYRQVVQTGTQADTFN